MKHLFNYPVNEVREFSFKREPIDVVVKDLSGLLKFYKVISPIIEKAQSGDFKNLYKIFENDSTEYDLLETIEGVSKTAKRDLISEQAATRAKYVLEEISKRKEFGDVYVEEFRKTSGKLLITLELDYEKYSKDELIQKSSVLRTIAEKYVGKRSVLAQSMNSQVSFIL